MIGLASRNNSIVGYNFREAFFLKRNALILHNFSDRDNCPYVMFLILIKQSMKKQLVAVFILGMGVSRMLFAQQTPTNNTPDIRTIDKIDNSGLARREVMLQLRADRLSIETTKEVLPGEDTPSANSEVYASYLSVLERYYNKAIKTIETDNTNDIFQLDRKSELKKRLSMVVSMQCLASKKDGTFARMKDLTGGLTIGVPLENMKANPRYGIVENFNQGFARIQKDQVFGYINICGEEIIPYQYDKAEPFNDGKALVRKIDWFLIDAKGNQSEALENVIDARAVAKGISIAQFKNGKFALIDNSYDYTKKPISDFFDELAPFNSATVFKVRADRRYGLLRVDGTMKLDLNYENIELANRPNLIRIKVGGKAGLVDSLGNVRVRPIYSEITSFDDYGFAKATDGEGTHLIKFPELQISRAFVNISDFDQFGYAIIKDFNQKYGVINRQLQTIKEPIYTSISAFNQYHLAAVCKVEDGDTKCGFMHRNSAIIVPINYVEVGEFNKEGLVVVAENVPNCADGKSCKTDLIYNHNGQIVVGHTPANAPQKVHYILGEELFSKAFIPVKTYDKDNALSINLLEKSSFRKITQDRYQQIKSMDANFNLIVQKDKMWGLIDSSGKSITQCIYKKIEHSTEGLYPTLSTNDKWGFIDKKGKMQVLFEYVLVRPFYNGLAIASKGLNQVGLINRFNAKISPCVFKEINFLSETRQYELVGEDGTKFVLNYTGDCESNCTKYEEVLKIANAK
jgi:WG containing repeat